MPRQIYSDHFGIEENPFAITPDPRYLYMTERHREALAHLFYGTGDGGGFVQLTGEVGTGKTTICRTFLEQLPENVDVALLLNPPESARELLMAIANELWDKPVRRDARLGELVRRLNDYLLDAHARGRRTVVIIDEAQNIKADVLEQVRLLTNLETATHKLMQVFLIGQPEFRQKLENPALRQVAQRITARYHLQPLTRQETEGYVQHRLAVAGGNRYLFNRSALKQVHRQSEGIPRAINIICERSLLGAYALDKQEVNSAIVRYAAREWRDTLVGSSKLATQTRVSLALAAVSLMCAGVAGLAGEMSVPLVEPQQLTASVQPEVVAAEEKTPQEEPDKGKDEASPPRLDKPTAVAEAPPSVETVTPSAEPPAVAPNLSQPVALEISQSAPLEKLMQQGSTAAGQGHLLQTVLARWGVDQVPAGDLGRCGLLDFNGVRCLREQGDWELLRRLNRPALLVINRPQEVTAYLAVVAMNDQGVMVASRDGLQQLSYDDIDSYWSGEFLLFWRPPLGGVTLIAEDSSEWAVEWLQSALQRFDGRPAYGRQFDAILKGRLRSFQKSQGLKVDGIAGPRTLIHLSALMDVQQPLLMADLRS